MTGIASKLLGILRDPRWCDGGRKIRDIDMKEKITFKIKGNPLIKFQSSDRIKQLKQGKIYANCLKYYRELEQETGDADIGDKFEAMFHINNGYLFNPKTNETIELKDALLSTESSNDYVFCMFGIGLNQNKFSFTDQQKEKMLTFGDTALIITDYKEFISRVKKAASKQGMQVHFDAVHYFKPNEDNANLIISLLKGMWNIAFWKRDRYLYQQEVRFVFVSDDKNLDHIELNIGDISDISVMISADKILNSICTKSDDSKIVN